MTSDAAPHTDAVILVGGQGTRLRPLTLSAPKPMLPTAGVPFLTLSGAGTAISARIGRLGYSPACRPPGGRG